MTIGDGCQLEQELSDDYHHFVNFEYYLDYKKIPENENYYCPLKYFYLRLHYGAVVRHSIYIHCRWMQSGIGFEQISKPFFVLCILDYAPLLT